MQFTLTVSSVFVLVAIGILHIYWAFGGKWGIHASLPQKVDGARVFAPPMLATLFVAVSVLVAAYLLAVQGDLLPAAGTTFIIKWGSIGCAAVFLLRTVGDFRYFGVFRKVRDTVFARNDARFYTPLCLYLAVSFIVALYN